MVHDSAWLPRRGRRRKIKAIQKFDKKLALDQLKGTPFEGGKNWPKITLTMRDEALGAKPLAEAVQAVLLDNLNMKIDLEVLEQRVFRERLWKQDLQFVWIRWFMDYPDPHNEYFDTFYGKKTTGRRQAWSTMRSTRSSRSGRDTRDPKKRLEATRRRRRSCRQDGGYVPVAWVVRYAAAKPWVKGIEKNKAGENVMDGNIYVSMLRAHLHGREGLAGRGPAPDGTDGVGASRREGSSGRERAVNGRRRLRSMAGTRQGREGCRCEAAPEGRARGVVALR